MRRRYIVPKPEVQRRDLKPGMQIMNKISGLIGTVRADSQDPKKLVKMCETAVAVKLTYATGHRGHTFWSLYNVERVVPHMLCEPRVVI